MGDNERIHMIKETRADPHLIHYSIDKDDVTTQLKRIGTLKAPRLDGLNVSDLKNQDPRDIACLLSIFLLHGDVPKDLKVNRTTMIPKVPEPSPSDWRPITIASMLDRLFAKILEARISRVIDLNPLQRAFIRGVDGCGENIAALASTIRIAKDKARPLVMMSMDLPRAFDSVKHSTIKKGTD